MQSRYGLEEIIEPHEKDTWLETFKRFKDGTPSSEFSKEQLCLALSAACAEIDALRFNLSGANITVAHQSEWINRLREKIRILSEDL